MELKKWKKIVIVMVIIIILESVMPTLTSRASVFDLIGDWLIDTIFEAISTLLGDLGDIIISGLQKAFMGNGDIRLSTGVYCIRYSPGIIFSGMVPALDANFISPMPDVEVINYDDGDSVTAQTIEKLGTTVADKILALEKTDNVNTDNQIGNEIDAVIEVVKKSGDAENRGTMHNNEFTIKGKSYNVESYCDSNNIMKITCYDSNGEILKEITDVTENTIEYDDIVSSFKDWLNIYFAADENPEIQNIKKEIEDLIVSCGNKIDSSNIEGESQCSYSINGKSYKIIVCLDKQEENWWEAILEYPTKTGEVLTSSAGKVRDSIATWYRAMLEIALVGLLCVLVYIAIRMIISSAAEDKVKYKKMLGDWVTAICIVLVLQFIMSLTFSVTGAINDVFKASIIGEHGEDRLISKVRTDMSLDEYDSFSVFADCIIYLVLIILTVMFTYQYLKRFIYIAFLMMIAPMIALTYPLDKVKDGQAQAFTMWIREFIFSVLIQPVHLIVYYIILGVSDTLAMENPVYAIVAISFILPAEKFIRKMFGFDKAEATSKIGSALGGAAVMNAINKIGAGRAKGGSQTAGATQTKVRTANTDAGDPYEALSNTGGRSAPAQNANQNTSQNTNQNTSQNSHQNQNRNPVPAPTSTSTPTPTPSPSTRNIKNKPSTLRGVGHVLGSGGAKLLKAAPRGTLKLAGAATLGTVGLAAGLATGDMEKAFAGAVGGIAAGKRVGGNIYDGTKNLGKGIGEKFGEGKYGKDEYARMQFDKEFKKSPEYKALIKKYKGQEADIQAFLNVGLTDAKQIGKALESVKNKKYSLKEAMAYMKMANAKDCPDEVLYDPTKFATYLTIHGADPSNADTIRMGIIDFK